MIREAINIEDLFPKEITPTTFNETREEMIRAFYERNDDIFIRDGETLGCTPIVEHEIILINRVDAPPKAKQRHYSEAIKRQIEKHCEEKLKQGVIRQKPLNMVIGRS